MSSYDIRKGSRSCTGVSGEHSITNFVKSLRERRAWLLMRESVTTPNENDVSLGNCPGSCHAGKILATAVTVALAADHLEKFIAQLTTVLI